MTSTLAAISTLTEELALAYDLPNRQPWMRRGLCRTAPDPSIFFSDWHSEQLKAKRICDRCPVIEDCLEWVLPRSDEAGVWGGTSPHDRVRIRKERKITGHRVMPNPYSYEPKPTNPHKLHAARTRDPLVLNALLDAPSNPGGLTRIQIEERTGLTSNEVYGSLHRLRNSGRANLRMIPPPPGERSPGWLWYAIDLRTGEPVYFVPQPQPHRKPNHRPARHTQERDHFILNLLRNSPTPLTTRQVQDHLTQTGDHANANAYGSLWRLAGRGLVDRAPFGLSRLWFAARQPASTPDQPVQMPVWDPPPGDPLRNDVRDDLDALSAVQ